MSRAIVTKTFHEVADGSLGVDTHRFVADVGQFADVALVVASLSTGAADITLRGSPLPPTSPLLADLNPSTNPRWALLPATVGSLSGVSSSFAAIGENALRSLMIELDVTIDLLQPSVVISCAERS